MEKARLTRERVSRTELWSKYIFCKTGSYLYIWKYHSRYYPLNVIMFHEIINHYKCIENETYLKIKNVEKFITFQIQSKNTNFIQSQKFQG